MKKYLAICGAAVMLMTSCAKQLDILPEQELEEGVALSSDANVKKVLNGAYDAISSGSLYGGDLMLYSELLGAGDEIRWEGTFNEPREAIEKRFLTTNSDVRDIWLNGYRTINIANNILSAISVVNAADQNRVQGEALFIRGSVYMELVKLFAKPYSAGNTAANLGLPIYTEPTREINEGSFKARNTLEETYTQIINDLTQAETLLANAGKNAPYANKGAAAGQLARAYLLMGRYQEARDAANRGISWAGSNGFAQTNSYDALFNNSAPSTEDLFTIIVNPQDGANNMHLYWSIPQFGGRDGDVSVQAAHLSLYSANDERRKLFYLDAQNVFRSGKWKLQYKNLPILRLSELYLIRAEGNSRLGTAVGDSPANDIKKIRERAGVAAIAAPTLDDILLERRLELAHEGQRIHDIKRLKQTTDGFAYDADKLVMPIPQREINANGALQQNPGY
ncbi:RagB/SusD family nutrient uptake outer membrane protein [Flavihumibacter rivuli]|uniref:RagB/SusD family nutrient uptake outer membrane protein n=1 Tax=Flavihumibacter rivuli TaxID=2838156 RepID=UPI001BDF6B22|nr:RagB/SusD family nutrient uptake outer membrane protein [Flavihumibacter rivuli]ULQ55152.1 RagB/SusD family nutrient uptake outer membrane protein [Flavihumibacter rivuli]